MHACRSTLEDPTDRFNGRWCVTPEYPTPPGTYAYFMTIDEVGNAVFPYIVGPQFYGVPACNNFDVCPTLAGACPGGCTGAHVSLPSTYGEWTPPTNYHCPEVCDMTLVTRRPCVGSTVTLEAHVRYTYACAYRWQRDGVDLSDGLTAGGAQLSGTATDELLIQGVSEQQNGQYVCRITPTEAACGPAFNTPVITLVACYANLDCSTTAPILNVLDFGRFANLFAAGNLLANCDRSTVPPVLNALDFSCFINKFAAGCS